MHILNWSLNHVACAKHGYVWGVTPDGHVLTKEVYVNKRHVGSKWVRIFFGNKNRIRIEMLWMKVGV